MRLQVLTNDTGEILGIVQPQEQQDAQVSARPQPDRGQRLLDIDVPDEVVDVRTPDEMHHWVRAFLTK
jgi:hypothetical protein